MNTRFTIEEENIVAIYAEDSRETTLENILAAMPYMDEDMRQLAAAAVNKLQAMTDSEFSEREFSILKSNCLVVSLPETVQLRMEYI